jgi:hypothetical protein
LERIRYAALLLDESRQIQAARFSLRASSKKGDNDGELLARMSVIAQALVATHLFQAGCPSSSVSFSLATVPGGFRHVESSLLGMTLNDALDMF